MLRCEDALLIVIDVQGKLARVVEDSEATIRQIEKLVGAFQILGVPVILTAQVPEKIGHTIPEIAVLLPEQQDIPRVSFSVFAERQISEWLIKHRKKQVLLCGFEAHICLYQSAIELLAAGYEVYLVVDAVSSRSRINKTVGVSELSAQGVHLTTVEMALFSMLKDARHPAFKAISQMIK